MCALLCVQARIIIDENTNENIVDLIDENVVDLIDENVADLIDENVVDLIDENVEEVQPIMVSEEDISEEVLTEEEQERRFGIPLQPCEDYSEVVIPLHIRYLLLD